MKYCSNCGAQMDDDVSFCSSCGARVANNVVPVQNMNVVSNVSQSQFTRQNTMTELATYYEYFSKKQNLYDEYDRRQQELPPLQAHGSGVPALVFGVIILSLTGVYVLASIPKFFKGSGFSATEVGWILFFIFLGVGLIVVRVVLENGRKKQVERIVNRIADIADELNQYYKDFGYCSIGAEYSNPAIISSLAELVKSGRADTPKEAINTMLDDAHKTQMELTAEMNLRYAAQTARYSRQSAASSTAAAAFIGLRFFGL